MAALALALLVAGFSAALAVALVIRWQLQAGLIDRARRVRRIKALRAQARRHAPSSVTGAARAPDAADITQGAGRWLWRGWQAGIDWWTTRSRR